MINMYIDNNYRILYFILTIIDHLNLRSPSLSKFVLNL